MIVTETIIANASIQDLKQAWSALPEATQNAIDWRGGLPFVRQDADESALKPIEHFITRHPRDDASVSLQQLVHDYLDTKAKESWVKSELATIRAMIEQAIPGKDEGTASESTGHYTVTVQRKMTRTVDTASLQAAWGDLDEIIQSAFRWKAELNTTDYKALAKNPKAAAIAAEFVTTKPASSIITIKELAA